MDHKRTLANVAIGEISIGIGQLQATLTKRQTRMMELAKAVALVGISGLQWDARNPIFWEGELF